MFHPCFIRGKMAISLELSEMSHPILGDREDGRRSQAERPSENMATLSQSTLRRRYRWARDQLGVPKGRFPYCTEPRHDGTPHVEISGGQYAWESRDPESRIMIGDTKLWSGSPRCIERNEMMLHHATRDRKRVRLNAFAGGSVVWERPTAPTERSR